MSPIAEESDIYGINFVSFLPPHPYHLGVDQLSELLWQSEFSYRSKLDGSLENTGL